MTTFEELYKRVLKAAMEKQLAEELRKLDNYDPAQLDCLLNPDKQPPVWRIGDCDCANSADCAGRCPFGAISADSADGNITIHREDCVGCSACIDNCKSGKLTAGRDILPVITALQAHEGLVYALIAPAFLGQFSHDAGEGDVTPGKLRSAFKALGFDGMIEVALFADILTLKEALEFDKNIHTAADYQLASCCCPMWIAMLRKIYSELLPHVPGAVSPMIACGRAIKALHPDAVTVFIGPCIAKKAEAKEADLKGAVDYVLTFKEVQDIFEMAELNPAEMEDAEKDHSSRAGRIYAHTGGVSEAVELTLQRLNAHRDIEIKTVQANGVLECKAMIAKLLSGDLTGNFFEGMGCVGGCVGGPKVLIDKAQGRENVENYGAAAAYPTPIDNPYVIELLKRLGLDTVEALLEQSDIFTRKF